jgi:hypothetical protein
MTDELKKCSHPACSCKVPEGSDYCSPYCHDAKGTLEISCNCGHPGCELS